MKILLQTANTQVSMEEEGKTNVQKSVYNSMTKYLPEILSIAESMLPIRK